MHRRQVLATGGAIAFGGIAGCLTEDGSDGVSDGDGDGYGPEVESPPEERSIDTDSYETKTYDDIDVPLAPVEDVYYWYQRQEARMADARGSEQFEEIRIVGAAFSPTLEPRSDDPVDEWPKSARIVTYCGCPHSLAGHRASRLIQDGYEEVYAIDEGLGGWIEHGYPVEGTEVGTPNQSYDISGRSDPSYAGEMVFLEQLDADRAEATLIADDGSYSMTLHYSGSPDSPFRLEAPDYTVEASLEELTSSEVSADMG